MDLINITGFGEVTDSRTGLSYGRVYKRADGWGGITAPKTGTPVVEVVRPTMRDAAIATAAAYVSGYEGES